MITTRWVLQEIAHFVQGFGYSLLVSVIAGFHLPLFGFFVGMFVELYQYFGPDTEELKLLDRICDIAFWTLGGVFILIFI